MVGTDGERVRERQAETETQGNPCSQRDLKMMMNLDLHVSEALNTLTVSTDEGASPRQREVSHV